MGILIPRQLTKEQYIKLFSNPISGIICDLGNPVRTQIDFLKDIRYSKSMMLGALRFWFDQLYVYYTKVVKMYNPIINVGAHVLPELERIEKRIEIIKELPNSFLFSHRYIQKGNIGENSADDIQCKLLKNKYPRIKDYPLHYQKTKHDPFFIMSIKGRIVFTIFPNEHPYINKQKITKVGITERGNVFVLHDGADKKK